MTRAWPLAVLLLLVSLAVSLARGDWPHGVNPMAACDGSTSGKICADCSAMVDCSTQEVILCEGVCASSLDVCALQSFPETCEGNCRATVLPFYDLANITNRRLVAPFQPSHSAPMGLLYVGYIEEQGTGGGFRRHVSSRASATPFTPPMGNWGVAYYEDGDLLALSAYHSDLADKDHFTKLLMTARGSDFFAVVLQQANGGYPVLLTLQFRRDQIDQGRQLDYFVSRHGFLLAGPYAEERIITAGVQDPNPDPSTGLFGFYVAFRHFIGGSPVYSGIFSQGSDFVTRSPAQSALPAGIKDAMVACHASAVAGVYCVGGTYIIEITRGTHPPQLRAISVYLEATGVAVLTSIHTWDVGNVGYVAVGGSNGAIGVFTSDQIKAKTSGTLQVIEPLRLGSQAVDMLWVDPYAADAYGASFTPGGTNSACVGHLYTESNSLTNSFRIMQSGETFNLYFIDACQHRPYNLLSVAPMTAAYIPGHDLLTSVFPEADIWNEDTAHVLVSGKRPGSCNECIANPRMGWCNERSKCEFGGANDSYAQQCYEWYPPLGDCAASYPRFTTFSPSTFVLPFPQRFTVASNVDLTGGFCVFSYSYGWEAWEFSAEIAAENGTFFCATEALWSTYRSSFISWSNSMYVYAEVNGVRGAPVRINWASFARTFPQSIILNNALPVTQQTFTIKQGEHSPLVLDSTEWFPSTFSCVLRYMKYTNLEMGWSELVEEVAVPAIVLDKDTISCQASSRQDADLFELYAQYGQGSNATRTNNLAAVVFVPEPSISINASFTTVLDKTAYTIDPELPAAVIRPYTGPFIPLGEDYVCVELDFVNYHQQLQFDCLVKWDHEPAVSTGTFASWSGDLNAWHYCCHRPPLQPTFGNMTIVVNGHLTIILHDRFHVFPTPIVTAISPERVPNSGGFQMEIFGSNFLPSGHEEVRQAARCVFDRFSARLNIVNDSFATCVLPAIDGKGAIPVQISLDGIVTTYSTKYLGQYAVTLLAHDISSNSICRVTDEPEALLKAREDVGLPFYPNLLANDRIAYYVDVNNVIMTVNNSRAAWRPDVVANLGFNTTGGLFDGDRCCKPTLLNFGYQCGVNFEDDSIAGVSITWPKSSPASVAGVVVSWFRPCFNMPDRYRVEYRTANDLTDTWVPLLENRGTQTYSASPCLTTTSDVETIALCPDYFRAVYATGIRIAFDNAGSEFADNVRSSGGWLYEVEVRGFFVSEPAAVRLQLYPTFGVAANGFLVVSSNGSNWWVDESLPYDNELRPNDKNKIVCLMNEPEWPTPECRLFANAITPIPTVYAGLFTVEALSGGQIRQPIEAIRHPAGVIVTAECRYLDDDTVVPLIGNTSILLTDSPTSAFDLALAAPKHGSYVLTFSAPGLWPHSFYFDVIPGESKAVTISVDSLSFAVGTQPLHNITVEVFDGAGQHVSDAYYADYILSLEVTSAPTPDSWAGFESTGSGYENLVDGVARFTVGWRTNIAGDYFLKVAVPSSIGTYEHLYRYIPLTVQAGPPAEMRIVEWPSVTAENSKPLAQQPVIAVFDELGNQIKDMSKRGAMQISITTIPAAFVENATVFVDDAGFANFTSFAINGKRGEGYELRFSATFSGFSASVPPLDTNCCMPPVVIDNCPATYTKSGDGLNCECDLGYEQALVAGILVCQPCAAGTYKSFSGPSSCIPCPSNTRAAAPGATSLNQCTCVEGFYAGADGECVPCLAGGVCAFGASLESLAPTEGYYRFAAMSSVFYECPVPTACLGGSEAVGATCAEGYEGPLCGVCQVGYGGESECLPCLDPGSNWALVVLIVIAVLALLVYTIYTTTRLHFRKTGVLKVMLNYLQLLSFLLYFDLTWPASIVRAFNVASVSTLQVNFSPVTCLFDMTYYEFFQLYAVIPLVGLALTTLVFAVAYFMVPAVRNTGFTRAVSRRFSFRSLSVLGKPSAASDAIQQAEKAVPVRRRILDAYITALVVVVFLSHPLITKHMLSVFNCRAFDAGPDEQVRYLAEDLSVSCSTDTHTTYSVAAGIILGVYCVGVPLLWLIIVSINRRKLNELDLQRRYRYIYNGFLDRAYFWEFVIMLRKASIVVVIVFLSSSVRFQTFGAMWLLSLFIGLHILFRPFRYRIVGILELMSLSAVFLTLMAGFTFHHNAEEKLISETLEILLLIFIFIVNATVIVFGVTLLTMDKHLERIVQSAMVKRGMSRGWSLLYNTAWWLRDGLSTPEERMAAEKASAAGDASSMQLNELGSSSDMATNSSRAKIEEPTVLY